LSPAVIQTITANLILDASRRWAGFEGLSKLRNERDLRGVVVRLEGMTEKKDAFSRTGNNVHLQNCVLELEPDGTFSRHEFSPKYRNRSRSPISYDPDATCPRFEKHLLEHLEKDDRELLQKYAGQCLLGKNITQTVLLLEGEAGASKGAFVRVLEGILGQENTGELRTQQLYGRFEIGRLANKSLLLGPDVPADFLSTESAARIKSMVGGDKLDSERKQSNDSNSYRNGDFNIVITTNCHLRVKLEGDRKAWERRLTIVSYDKPFKGPRIPDIHEMLLREEGPGILNWCLGGRRKLYEDISGETGTLVVSARQLEKVHRLLSESDSLKIFLKENVVHNPDENATGAEIISAYNQYCIKAEWTPIPYTRCQKQLDDLMLELFSTARVNDIKRHEKAQRGFRRVQLKDSIETDTLSNALE
jgi:putative DNA primase/helicase